MLSIAWKSQEETVFEQVPYRAVSTHADCAKHCPLPRKRVQRCGAARGRRRGQRELPGRPSPSWIIAEGLWNTKHTEKGSLEEK